MSRLLLKMKDILLAVVPAAILSVISYILGYKKNVTEVDGSRLDNLEKSINVYNVIIDDMAQKIEHLTGEIAKLELRIEELLAENKQLKSRGL